MSRRKIRTFAEHFAALESLIELETPDFPRKTSPVAFDALARLRLAFIPPDGEPDFGRGLAYQIHRAVTMQPPSVEAYE